MSEKLEMDPELVDDRDDHEEDIEPVELPEYDHSQFELPEDYVDEDDDDG